MIKTELISPGIYLHSKSGNEYLLIGETRHSETLEEMVLYYPQYGEEAELWVRPKSMWNELVEIDGEMVPRFVKVEND